jgi:hypothetical protein
VEQKGSTVCERGTRREEEKRKRKRKGKISREEDREGRFLVEELRNIERRDILYIGM